MCNCFNNFNRIKKLAQIYKTELASERVAIYKTGPGFNFCEYEFAKNNNYDIVEVI